MDCEKFVSVCQALWGANWHGRAAEVLQVAYKTVSRWERGSIPIPAGVAAELAKACRQQSAILTQYAKALEKA